jgi:hypothetical protein
MKERFFSTSSFLVPVLAEVKDIIVTPREKLPYTTVRTELVNRLSPSRDQSICQLLTLDMGDRKPCQFLCQRRSLAPDMSNNFICSIWSGSLPFHNVQTILADQPEGELNAEAHCADRITDVASLPAPASVDQLSDNNALLQYIENFARQVGVLSAERARPGSSGSRSSPRNRRPDRRSFSRKEVATNRRQRRHTFRYSQRPPHHRQMQQAAVPHTHGIGALNVPS